MTFVYRFYSFHQELEDVFLFLLFVPGHVQLWVYLRSEAPAVHRKSTAFGRLKNSLFYWVSCHLCVLLLLFETKMGVGELDPFPCGLPPCFVSPVSPSSPCFTDHDFALICWIWFSLNFVTEPEVKVEVTCEWM